VVLGCIALLVIGLASCVGHFLGRVPPAGLVVGVVTLSTPFDTDTSSLKIQLFVMQFFFEFFSNFSKKGKDFLNFSKKIFSKNGPCLVPIWYFSR
jgi:hypothetical protein